jgi:DNA-binding response OmpR family regulator
MAQAAQTQAGQLDPPRSARVMIADENLDHVAMTAVLLRTEGYDVRGVTSGSALLEQFEAFRPDVVILDIGMPGLNGYEVARALRANSTSADVLLIALTGHGTQTDKHLAQLAGFDYHVVKPADPETLSAAIRDVGGNRLVRAHAKMKAESARLVAEMVQLIERAKGIVRE